MGLNTGCAGSVSSFVYVAPPDLLSVSDPHLRSENPNKKRLTLSSYPSTTSRAFPSRSLTHSSVIVAPNDTNLAVIEPSGARSVVTSNG